jgi:spectinomycin phosphotransferase
VTAAMREKPSIPEDHLKECLEEQYGMGRVALYFLPLGLDTRAGLYRVVSEEGRSYFARVKSGPLYEPSCFVPRFLSDCGIESVVPPLYNKTAALWTKLEDWTVTIYAFLYGDTGWAGMTDEHWKATGETCKRIHEAALPYEMLQSLRKETFDPTDYISWVAAFEAQHLDCEPRSPAGRAVYGSWMAHRPAILSTLAALERLADELRRRTFPQVICHADLHPGNLLRDRGGQVFVIDWEDVMVAPKERDFIFVKELQARGSTPQDQVYFFQGYGHADIDWAALTYYRHERVVQDLIECARNVFFRDDLGEGTKSQSAQLLDDILREIERRPGDEP